MFGLGKKKEGAPEQENNISAETREAIRGFVKWKKRVEAGGKYKGGQDKRDDNLIPEKTRSIKEELDLSDEEFDALVKEIEEEEEKGEDEDMPAAA